MAKWVCSCLTSCFLLVIISVANPESSADEDAGRDINDPQPFRVKKLNMMWDKAKQVSEHFTSGISPYGMSDFGQLLLLLLLLLWNEFSLRCRNVTNNCKDT